MFARMSPLTMVTELFFEGVFLIRTDFSKKLCEITNASISKAKIY